VWLTAARSQEFHDRVTGTICPRGSCSTRKHHHRRDCDSPAPAIFSLRYNCPLHTAICYRVKLGEWRIDVGDEIPTRINGVARSTADIMLDVNRAFELAVRRDPANWFWVHKRWKPVKAAKGETKMEDGE